MKRNKNKIKKQKNLLHFLFFGSSDKYKTQDKLFNDKLLEATELSVEGCINIEGEDYVIKRTITRPQLKKRTAKSKANQKVEYYRLNITPGGGNSFILVFNIYFSK